MLLTFGTGIGSAVIHNGVLLPNTEFGHLEVGGKEAEHRAASSVKETQGMELRAMDRRGDEGARVIENAIWPDLFIAGGGISRKAQKWIPLLNNRTPVVAAALQNTAASLVRRWPPTSTSPLRHIRPRDSKRGGERLAEVSNLPLGGALTHTVVTMVVGGRLPGSGEHPS